MKLLVTSLQFIADSAVDVLPIAVFLFAFQRLIIGEPLANWKQIVVGFLFVVVGLGLFLEGLEQSPGTTITGSICSPSPLASAQRLRNRR
jgi:hypothetical protein